jgi:branched-chain amino acid transport system permease protein
MRGDDRWRRPSTRVGLLEVYGVYYMDELVAAGFGRVFPLLVMLFVMLVKPYGLWGTERIERV